MEVEANPLRIALERFDTGFASLSGDDQKDALEVLSTAFNDYGNMSQPYEAASYAFRELEALIGEKKSILACEVMLKLLLSRQAEAISNDGKSMIFGDCLEVLVSVFENAIRAEDVGSVASIILLFQNAVLNEQVISGADGSRIKELGTVLARFFANEKLNTVNARRAIEEACRTTIPHVFRVLSPEEHSIIIFELVSSGIGRYFDENANKMVALTEFSVDRFEKNGKAVVVDTLSAIVFTLIQGFTWFQDRSRVALEFVSRMLTEIREKDKDRIKAAFLWIRQVTQDALNLLRAPEYPGAELFLLNMEALLINCLRDKSPGLWGLQSLAMELLGNMYEAIVNDDAKRERFWVPPARRAELQEDQLAARPTEEVIACPCGSKQENGSMIDCDRCHRWFHMECVGVNENMPDMDRYQFHCDDCMVFEYAEQMENSWKDFAAEDDGVTRTPTRPKALKATSGAGSNNDHLHRRLELIRNYLQFQFEKSKDESFGSAIFTYRSQLEDIPEEGDASRSSLPPQMVVVKNCISRYGASRLCRLISYESQSANDEMNFASANSREVIFKAVVAIAGMANQIGLKKAAVEALGEMLAVTNDLAKRPELVEAINALMEDEAISVRDAVLTRLVTQLRDSGNPQVSGTGRTIILNLIEDPGLQVRKHAVSLACEDLGSQNVTEAAETLSKLSARLRDPREEQTLKDVIKSAILSYFQQVDPNTIAGALMQMLQDAEIILPNVDRISMLLKLPVPSETSSDDSSSDTAPTKAAQTTSTTKAKKLREQHDGYMAKLRAILESVAQNLAEAKSESDRIKNLSLMRAFSKIEPALLDEYLRHLVSLIFPQPLPSKAVAAEVAEIFATCSPKKLDTETQATLESHLKDLVWKGHQILLSPSIRALQGLYEATNQRGSKEGPRCQALRDIVEKFYRFIAPGPTDEKHEVNSKTMSHYKRAIYGLGLVVRYHFPMCSGMFQPPAEIAKAVLGYCRSQVPADLRRQALRSVGLLLVRIPDPRIVSRSLFNGLIDPDSQTRSQSLAAFLDMLKGAAEVKNDMNENCLTAFVWGQLSQVKELLHDQDKHCRLNALLVLEHLLKCGQVHGEQLLADLISLERDPELRPLVHPILLERFTKTRESMPVSEGIFLSRASYPSSSSSLSSSSSSLLLERSPSTLSLTPNGSSTTTARSPPSKAEMDAYLENESVEGFVDCYRDFVLSGPVKNRYETLKRLVDAIFKPDSDDAESQWNGARFRCKILASLPYKYLDEVLYVCHRLEKTCTLEADRVRNKGKLDAVLGPVLKTIAKRKKTAAGERASVDNDPEMEQLVDGDIWKASVRSVRIALALRLKQHLQALYRLSNIAVNAATNEIVPAAKNERTLDDRSLPIMREFSVPNLSWSDGAMTLNRTKGFVADKMFVHLILAMKDNTKDPTIANTPSTGNSGAAAAARAESATRRPLRGVDDDDDQDIEDYYPAEPTLSTSSSATKSGKKRGLERRSSSSTKKSKKNEVGAGGLDDDQDDAEYEGSTSTTVPSSSSRQSKRHQGQRQKHADGDDNEEDVASVASPVSIPRGPEARKPAVVYTYRK